MKNLCNWCWIVLQPLRWVALIVWFTTNGMYAKNNNIYVARTSNNRVIIACELGWFYLAIINIQLEKNKLVQGRQGIEGTRRLSSRCPLAVKLALFCPVSTCGGAYMWEGGARWSTQLRRGVLGRNRSLSMVGLLRSARTWAWQRKYKPS